MKKEKIGLIFASAIIGSFIVLTVLQSLNLENSYPNAYETIFLTLVIVAASSGILLWGMCMWDCLGNKEIKSPTLVFGLLILFNWVASIVYYFRFIFGRSKREKIEAVEATQKEQRWKGLPFKME